MALAEPWHIRSRSRECSVTQRRFVDGEIIVTALFPDPESSGYLRRDFCTDAWAEYPTSEEDPKPFSFWRTAYAAPETVEKAEAIRKDSAEDILKRLVEEDEDYTENTRYILAIMLERQKLLRETDSQRTPNGILRVYEHRKTGEVLIIKDPDLPLDQIEAVQEEVIVLLENNGRLPDKEPAAETEAPEETPAPPSEETVALSEAAESEESEIAEVSAETVITATAEEAVEGEAIEEGPKPA
ncbi:hypothetical protein JIN85_02105 [Luteolibacter pohnpeiensis]|uniref:Uncharacterized protein n=1 Tax=Luteolibacter pohnpeiensis TaxID=454153 RepID=A0A934S7L7_9BACT|nr:hypothetical protein [Luteolibacter pohnpeiensis]MBK1881187.1 hypothetical protein [Luteolibacter pohnpeiensis]